MRGSSEKSISENILILTFWSWKEALIQTYTLPYVYLMREALSKDKKIYLATLEKDSLKLSPQNEIQAKQESLKSGFTWIPLKNNSFGIKAVITSLFQLTYLIFFCFRHRIKVIHIWCTPPGVTAWILCKITGAKLIIDSYEPHAEAMVENGTWNKDSFRFKLLFKFEKLITKQASVIISATQGMREYAQRKYHVAISRFYVKPACVDLKQFGFENKKDPALLEKLNLKDKIVGVYAGKFGGIYLDKEVFEFIKAASDYWGNKFMMLILTNHTRQEIDNYCSIAGLDPDIVISQFVSHQEIANYIGLADFGLTPVKPVPTKRYCTPIKDGEYWALGLPVVITKDISDDSDIIKRENIGAILEGFAQEDYQRSVIQIADLLENNTPKNLYLKIRSIAEAYRNYNLAKNIYSEIYT